MMVPMTTVTLDCHTMTVPSCRPDSPNVFRTARSRLRRRTDATSVVPRARAAPTARLAPSTAGITTTECEFTISSGRSSETTPPAEPELGELGRLMVWSIASSERNACADGPSVRMR